MTCRRRSLPVCVCVCGDVGLEFNSSLHLSIMNAQVKGNQIIQSSSRLSSLPFFEQVRQEEIYEDVTLSIRKSFKTKLFTKKIIFELQH